MLGRNAFTPRAFCLCDPGLPEASVAYKDVPLPSRAEMDSILGDIPMLAQRATVAPVDATALVDMSLRFACLAYRRNSQLARNALVLRDDESSRPYGVELQFRGKLGGHAVIYLAHVRPGRLSAVLSFKGSTLSSPGAPLLSDWVQNLSIMLPWRSSSAAVGAHLAEGSDANVHTGESTSLGVGSARSTSPVITSTRVTVAELSDLIHLALRNAVGWHEYLQELLEAFRQYHLALLPDDLAAAWGLPQELDLWSLLCSRHCHQVLLVGHSLGGALAAMTATLLGSAHHARALAEGAMAEGQAVREAAAATGMAGRATNVASAVGVGGLAGVSGASGEAISSSRDTEPEATLAVGRAAGAVCGDDSTTARTLVAALRSNGKEIVGAAGATESGGSGETAGAGPSEAAVTRASSSSWGDWTAWNTTWKDVTWKEFAGRSTGGDGYVFGDLTRSARSALGLGSPQSAAQAPAMEERAGTPGQGTEQGARRGGEASGGRSCEAQGEAAGAVQDLDQGAVQGLDQGAVQGLDQGAVQGVGSARGGDGPIGTCEGQPMLVTFGCPVVGDSGFVAAQNRHVAMDGGLRVFNEMDPIPATGYGLMSISTAVGGASADHGGLPIPLRNDSLTAANPYTNHLRYCVTSYELCRTLCRDQPALRVRYLLPGLHYLPDENNGHIAPSPLIALPPFPEKKR